MPSRTDESPRVQHDRHRQPGSRPIDEPRNFDVRGAAFATPGEGAHPGFDEHLNPIDDEHINTRGSER
jgi:hypothetical protein